MIANQFKIAAVRSIRTSTIILATSNAIAAFATAMCILYEAYSREKRNNRKFRFSQSGFSFVPSGEVYPLVLSLGITIQGTAFAVAQSNSLDNISAFGCTLVSQLMLPAVFVAPYIQLVFAVELALRGLRKKPFVPRDKWTVGTCLSIVILFLLANFLVAIFDRTVDFCFASLFWFIAKYAVGCFTLLTTISAIILICAVSVFVRLHRSSKIEVTERVNASRMVYYLALAFISNTFMIPFFFTLAFEGQGDAGNQALTLSMVASVVANLSGLMTGVLYLFLKSNTISTISPRSKGGEYDRRELNHTIRRFGPSDPDFNGHMMQPVSGPGCLHRMGSDASLITNEKGEEAGIDTQQSPPSLVTRDGRGQNPLRSDAVYPTVSIPRTPEPAQVSSISAVAGHAQKRSYSLFPNNSPSSKSSIMLLPATIYTPNSITRTKDTESALDVLKPPSSLRNLTIGRHRRDSSMVSSATVQIGLRISSVEDLPPMSNRATVVEPDVVSLDSSKEKLKPTGRRPSLLSTTEPAMPIPDGILRRDPVKDARMKTLPPVPRPGGPFDEDDGEEQSAGETLSSSVYSPTNAKPPSSNGLGFAMPISRANSGNPMSPPSRGINGALPRPADTKADWI